MAKRSVTVTLKHPAMEGARTKYTQELDMENPFKDVHNIIDGAYVHKYPDGTLFFIPWHNIGSMEVSNPYGE